MSNTRLNDFISYGTNAQRLAFTPSVPTPASGNSPAYIWYETDTTNTYAYAAGAWHAVNNSSGAVTTTGTPASGELAKFSGSGTITNGDLSGDVATSGTLATTIAAAAVSLAKMANLAANSIIGNNTGSAATPIALTQAQATALLNAMVGDSGSGGTKGLVPAPASGDASKFLKGDGTWAAGGGGLTLISEYVADGTTGTQSFTSIPGTYRDLILIVRGRGDTTATSVSTNLQFNGDTAANYDHQRAGASSTTVNGAGAVGDTAIQALSIAAASAPSNAADVGELGIFDYRGTTFQKAVFSRATLKTGTASASNLRTDIWSGWWRSTAAITRVDISLAAGNFVSGSVISLYGRM